MRGILPFAPFDLVDFFLNLQGFEIIEFGFMRLKLGVEFVLACFLLFVTSWDQTRSKESALYMTQVTYCFVPFEEYDASALVTSS